MTAARQRVVLLGAALSTLGVITILLRSEREDASIAWAVLGPIVVWSFVGTGLYAAHRRPGSRVGVLMVALGFAWCVAAISLANSAFAFSLGLVVGGLWGGVFLHLIVSFPTGRLPPGTDRRIVLVGYGLFTLGAIPALLFSGPQELACDDCPENLWLIERDADLANGLTAVQTASYAVLLVVVIARLSGSAGGAPKRSTAPRSRRCMRAAWSRSCRDRGDRRRHAGVLVGGLRRHRAAADRVPRRAAAEPRRAPRRRARHAAPGAAPRAFGW